MSAFFRYPHTPHLAWLGTGQPRQDKVLTDVERKEFLSHELAVEEKVDGANVGFSIGNSGELRIQNRGSFLTPEAAASQFKPLFRWVDHRCDSLVRALGRDRILFGEWCYAVHSVRYSELPDWFLAFDVYDRSERAFLSVYRRDLLVKALELAAVPRVGTGRFNLESLRHIVGKSALGASRGEGLYLRALDSVGLVQRAKLVTPEFTQAIDEHWSRRSLKTNRILTGVPVR